MEDLWKKNILFSFFVLVYFNASAQINFNRNDSYTVLSLNGDTLKNPWAGGFNYVQFSEIDLNLDGIKDLFVFDRSGNRISTFINAGTPNEVSYKHEPQYIQNFPSNLHDWVILRDYNCDGKTDIFTYNSGGIAVYKNISTSSLEFEFITDEIQSNFVPTVTNLFVSSGDIPAIDDIDNDGDLDILTFSLLGAYVEYHKNLSMENYGTCDSLDFEIRNRCWGYFSENSSTNVLTLFDTCSFNVPIPEKQEGGLKHSGSTLFTLDVDANDTKDLVLGDISFNNFILLINGDPSSNFDSSIMVSQDSAFPKNHLNTVATNLSIFPAGFYLDVNNDNVKDLIAAPNCSLGCENTSNVWYYENNNATNNPNFELITRGFLQEEMIDVGEDAHPVFFDYNSDGLLDIIVGNQFVFDTLPPHKFTSSLFLYKNIGSLESPSFQLVDTNYANISSINLDLTLSQPAMGLAPTFGDLDNDGDDDMILGDFNGKLHLFTNSAGAGNPAQFSLTTPEYFGIDVGSAAAPQLIDLNRDLLLDLVIGRRDGFFSYYENDGSLTNPSFTLITDSLGKVRTRTINEFNGNSVPFIYDDNGSYRMLSGSNGGWIFEYENIDNNLDGNFTAVDSSFLGIWEGGHSFIDLADVNNDEKLDLLIGNTAGGISFYKGDFPETVNQINSHLKKINIYPNPTKNKLIIDLEKNDLTNAYIKVNDILGNTVFKQKINQQKNAIRLNKFAKGIYFVSFSNSFGNKTFKVIKE